jgi:tetratricopeptide (TPR) repeat protein
MRLLKEIHNLTENYHVKSGVYHYYRNEFKQAEEFFRKALAGEEIADADRRMALHYLTLSLMDRAERCAERGEADEGAEHLRRAVEVSAKYPDIHYRLGCLLEQLDRNEEAAEAYRAAIGVQSDYLDAHVALGFCLLRCGRAEEAGAAMQQALKLKRARIEEPFRRGIELLEQGKIDDAVDQFHTSFRSSPVLCQEFRAKAVECLKSEDYPNALEELDRALGICPKYPDLHNLRGVVLCELERIAEAVDAFRLSAALSPRYLVPRLNLAFALVRVEEYREAEGELEAILELDPTQSAAAAKLEELRTGKPPEKRRRASRGSGR